MEIPALQPVNPLGAIAQAQQIRSGQQEMALRNQAMQAQQQQIEQQQMQMDSQRALMKAYQDAGGDLNKAVPLAAKYGATPGDVIKLRQSALEQQKQALDLLTQRGTEALREADLMQGAHDQVAKASPDTRPVVYQQTLQQLKAAGVDISQVPPQYPGDQAFAMLGVGLKGHKQILEETAKSLENDKTVAQTGEANAKAAEATAGAAKTTTQNQQLQQFGGMSPELMQSKYVFLQQQKALGKPLAPQDQAFLTAYEKNKTLVPQATINLQAGLLNNDAKQMAAQSYAQTGALPAGMRSPAMSAQILNTAANNGATNIAGNKAAYQANADSLKSMQKQFDNVTAFENTAGKNLDTFLGAAKKMVDTGSPFLNTPVRQLSDKMVGSENMAAVNAARTTALAEISKVLTSANAGSGVVSDSARHEVEGLIGPNATIKQIYAAANILKQDMANRHQAYAQQLGEIKSRIGGQQQPADQEPHVAGYQVGQKVVIKGGKTVTITAVHPDGTFDAN